MYVKMNVYVWGCFAVTHARRSLEVLNLTISWSFLKSRLGRMALLHIFPIDLWLKLSLHRIENIMTVLFSKNMMQCGQPCIPAS